MPTRPHSSSKILSFLFLALFGSYSCQKKESIPTKVVPIKAKKELVLTAAKAKTMAEKLFESDSKRIIEYNSDAGGIDVMESTIGDFTGDGIADVVIYYSLTPAAGGNAIVGQGLLLYQNYHNQMVLIEELDPDYLFSFTRIAQSKIYIEKLEYAEEDGRCCPSIKTEVKLTVDPQKIKRN